MLCIPVFLLVGCDGEGGEKNDMAARPAARNHSLMVSAVPMSPVSASGGLTVNETKQERISALLKRFDSLSYGEEYRETTVELAKLFAQMDPERGLSWINSLESTPENIPLAGVFAMEIAKIDPVKAVKIGQSLSSDGLRQVFFKAALSFIALSSPDQSLQMLSNAKGFIPRPAEVYLEILKNISMGSEPEVGWKYYKLVEKSAGTQAALVSFFRNAAVANASLALNYVSHLSVSEDQKTAIREIFTGVPETELLGLSGKLNQMSAGPVKDAGILQLASRIMHTSPVDAAKWAQAINDEKIKASSLAKIVSAAKSFDVKLADRIQSENAGVLSSTQQVNE